MKQQSGGVYHLVWGPFSGVQSDARAHQCVTQHPSKDERSRRNFYLTSAVGHEHGLPCAGTSCDHEGELVFALLEVGSDLTTTTITVIILSTPVERKNKYI